MVHLHTARSSSWHVYIVQQFHPQTQEVISLPQIVLSILSPGILKVVLNLASRPPPKEQFSWHAQPSKESYGHKKCPPLELTTKTNSNQAWLPCPCINVPGALQTGIKKEGNPTMGWHRKIRASYEPTFALQSIAMPVLIKTMSALNKILNCSYCPKHLFQLNNEVHTLEQPWALYHRFKEPTIPWLHCSKYQLHMPLYNGLPVKSGSKTLSYPLRSTTNELMGVKIEKHKNSQQMTTDSATTQDVLDFCCSKLLTFKTVALKEVTMLRTVLITSSWHRFGFKNINECWCTYSATLRYSAWKHLFSKHRCLPNKFLKCYVKSWLSRAKINITRKSWMG